MSPEHLEYTPEGQALCRPCRGVYLSTVASRDALANGVYRRCTCGGVLPPEGDPSATPQLDSGGLDLGYFFQADVYRCNACGTHFKVQHGVMASLLFAMLGLCGYGVFHAVAEAPEDVVLWLVFVSVPLAIAAYDVYCRIRYPRIKSLDYKPRSRP